MFDTLAFQRLDIYKTAKELARLVHQGHIRDAELRDQATRASKSTFLSICEGLPSDAPGIRRRHFDIANNSLHEVVGALDTEVAQAILAFAVRVKRMIRALRGRLSE